MIRVSRQEEINIFAVMNTTPGGRAALKYIVLLIVTVLWFLPSLMAQVPEVKRYSVISPPLQDFLNRQSAETRIRIQVITADANQLKDSLTRLEGATLMGEYKPLSLIFIEVTPGWINRIAGWSGTLFVDLVRVARPELFTGTMDGAVNRLNRLWNQYPQFTGNAITLGIKENSFDTADIDYSGRVRINPNATAANNSHASVMATISAGAGNSWYAARGAARGSRIVSSSFNNLLPDPAAFFQAYGVTVQNHSYGTGIENFYGPESLAYDQQVIANTELVHVFSAGNSGTAASSSGPYAGITGYANLTGQFKMSKNIITVGATDSFYTVAPASSRGPAFDGRIKPELVALGEDGTSGSTALTSGVVAVLQDAYQQLNGGNLPPASLVKAILVNSADDIGSAGPDYQSGYGSLNAAGALETLVSGNVALSAVQPLQEQLFNLVVPAGCRRLKITMAWTDPPAGINAGSALVNDLDLELDYPAGMQTWLPWTLSAFPHPDSLALPAVRRRDRLNNLEQVTLEFPAPGNYIIRVKGTTVNTAQQPFDLAWQFETADMFVWNYPMRDDPILGGETNVLHWKSTISATTGVLQYSLDDGNSWQLVDAAADLARGYYRWSAPATFSKCLLRMVAGSAYESDTVVISNPLTLTVGFNCSDSFQLRWQSMNGASRYRLFRLGTRYMEPVLEVTDTSIVLQKQANPDLYYAVVPVREGREGVRSFSINYTWQGLACYFKSFYADQLAGTARVQLELGSLYNIRRIIIVKYTGRDSVVFQNILNPVSLTYIFTDPGLRTGATSYRAYLETVNGNRIVSELVTIIYSAEDRIFVYPNPVRRGQPFTLVLNDNQNGEIQVLEASGRLMRAIPFSYGGVLTIETSSLSAGIYLLKIRGHERIVQTAKLVVY